MGKKWGRLKGSEWGKTRKIERLRERVCMINFEKVEGREKYLV